MVPPFSSRISRVPPYSRTAKLSTRTGLSPALARLSRRFRFLLYSHWPGPRSLATTNGVSVDVLSSGYLDVSVRRVRFPHLCIQYGIPLKAVGFPIRKSSDQSLLPTPRGLSQGATSFIASIRQGIHQMPLPCLRTPYVGANLHTGSATRDFAQPLYLPILPDCSIWVFTFDNPSIRRSPRRARKPIHDLKEQTALAPHLRPKPETLLFLIRKIWWSRTGSNRRPEACKATALPTELRPRCCSVSTRKMVGPGGLEPPTSRLSGVRSSHLSYEP